METFLVYYYSFLAVIIGCAVGHYFILSIQNDPGSQEHYIGVNLTKDNETCRLTWLGGWDFDSIYTNVTVNGVNKGHPSPMTVIYNGTCQNDILVEMYDRTVRSDRELYRYNATEGK